APIADALPLPRNAFLRNANEVELRLDPRIAGIQEGRRTGIAEVLGYMRFVDGRDPDVWCLPLFADAAMPALFNVIAPVRLPTIEMTGHVRARPVPGWLAFQFRSRFVFDDLLEEDGELWDGSGTLVAQSRQLAQVPRPA